MKCVYMVGKFSLLLNGGTDPLPNLRRSIKGPNKDDL